MSLSSSCQPGFQESFVHSFDFCQEDHRFVIACMNGSVIETHFRQQQVSDTPSPQSTLQCLHSVSSTYKRLSLEGDQLFDTLARRESIRTSLSALPDHLNASWSLLSNGGMTCCVTNLSLPQGVTCIQLCIVGMTEDWYIVNQSVETCSGLCQFTIDPIPVMLTGVCEAHIRLIASLDSSAPLTKEIHLGSISIVDIGLTSRGTQAGVGILQNIETLPVLSSLSRSDVVHLISNQQMESMKIGSVQFQVVSRGSSHSIVLQSSDPHAIVMVRARLLQAMLSMWKSDGDGWQLNSEKNQVLLDTCIQRLQSLEIESTSTTIVDAIKELLDINEQVSSLLELYYVCL